VCLMAREELRVECSRSGRVGACPGSLCRSVGPSRVPTPVGGEQRAQALTSARSVADLGTGALVGDGLQYRARSGLDQATDDGIGRHPASVRAVRGQGTPGKPAEAGGKLELATRRLRGRAGDGSTRAISGTTVGAAPVGGYPGRSRE
jgi:hypothetical protein